MSLGSGSSSAGVALRRLRGAFLVLAALIAVGAAIGVAVMRAVNREATHAFVEEALPVQRHAEDLVTQMTIAQSAMRGFVVLREPAVLMPLAPAERRAAADLYQLDRLARGDSQLRALAVSARRQVADLERYLASQIALVRAGRKREASARVRDGDRAFARFRATAVAIEARAEQFVADQRSRQSSRVRRWSIVLLLLGLMALAIVSAIALRVPRRYAGLLRSVEEERDAAGRAEARIATLQGLTGELAAQMSVDRVAEVAAERVVEAAGAVSCGVYLMDEDAGDLVRHSIVDRHGRANDGHGRVALDSALPAAAVFREGTPRWLSEPGDWAPFDERVRALATERGSLHVALVPLLADGHPVGVLYASFARSVPLDDELRAFVSAVAAQVGLAVERGLRVERERRARHEAEELSQALERLLDVTPLISAAGGTEEVQRAVCVAARRTFAADAAALWRREGDEMVLLARDPPTLALPAGTRLAFADYPMFASAFPHAGGERVIFLRDLERDDPETWRGYASRTGARAQVRLPLALRDAPPLLVVASWAKVPPAPDAALRAVAARFANEAALALADAERRFAEQDAARLYATLEAGLLPRLRVSDARVHVVARYRAGEQRLRLGGDLFGACERADGWIVAAVGDVAGHGAEAAALGASVRAAWAGLARAGVAPSRVLRVLDAHVLDEAARAELFVTLCHVELDPVSGLVRIACAGHPPPLLLDGGASELSAPAGPPLGVEGGDWDAAEADVRGGATLLLYTDGIVEGRDNPGGSCRYGLERLLVALERHRNLPVAARLDALLAEAAKANGGPLNDDVALLALTLATGR